MTFKSRGVVDKVWLGWFILQIIVTPREFFSYIFLIVTDTLSQKKKKTKKRLTKSTQNSVSDRRAALLSKMALRDPRQPAVLPPAHPRVIRHHV